MKALAEPTQQFDLRLVEQHSAQRVELDVRLETDRSRVPGEVGEIERGDLAMLDPTHSRSRRGEETSHVELTHSGGDSRDPELTADLGENPPGEAARFV